MVYSCRFESHIGISLKDHLKAVSDICQTKCHEIIDNADDISLARIIGLTHDIGKYTNYFQEYLRGKTNYNRELTAHAPLSSLYTAWLLAKLGKDPLTIAIGMLCVYSHHRSLDKSINTLSDLICDYVNNDNYKKQIESLSDNMNVISDELKALGLVSLDQFISDVKMGLKEVRRKLFNLYIRYNDELEAFRTFYRILLLFSILIDSDKKIAAALHDPQRRDINIELVKLYTDKIRKDDRLYDLRRSIREDVMNSFDMIMPGELPHILSINAPTGAGKTLLALTIALKLRDELKRRVDKLYRIIYVLPYINIIEQTYDVFSKIFTNSTEDITLLLKHHHLYFPHSDDETSLDDKLMLMESWDSEIIITTFVQFMETLLGTKNRILKKFHKLYNAIIILDEIQTIPIEYWLLVKKALLALSTYSYIIFMTATKPSIFDSGEYKELVTNSESYFKQLNRVRYRIYDEPMNLDALSKLILTTWNSNSSMLVIINKISTSIELYKKIKERCNDLMYVDKAASIKPSELVNRPLLIYLSTNIIPKERLDRIRLINELIKRKNTVLVISTQLVEAGVDLDFDVVIRDIGPFDSIIQAAGRCNRNWNRDEGNVHIVKLKSISNDKRLDSEDIYGSLTIDITEEILGNRETFRESDIFDMINMYYKSVSSKRNVMNNEKSKKFIDAIRKLDFCNISDFQVIKDRPTIPIFVEIDENAARILNDFRNVLSVKDNSYKEYNIRARLRMTKSRLEEYMVETWN
ncbi:MAG: CRISPR-associated helicase Cas3', partial [Candidatus Nitrosocaldus sp.]